jgi:hypothetical protein
MEDVLSTIVKVATALEKKGLYKEADFLDSLLIRLASELENEADDVSAQQSEEPADSLVPRSQKAYSLNPEDKKKAAVIEMVCDAVNLAAPTVSRAGSGQAVKSYRARLGIDRNINAKDEPLILVGFVGELIEKPGEIQTGEKLNEAQRQKMAYDAITAQSGIYTKHGFTTVKSLGVVPTTSDWVDFNMGRTSVHDDSPPASGPVSVFAFQLM